MNIHHRVLNLALEIQQIPAPTFEENQRAEFIREKFVQEKLDDVEIDDLGNVFGRLPGRMETRPIVVSAHSDTVFPLDTDLSTTYSNNIIKGPGIGDNSLGIAGLFGLLWQIAEKELIFPGDLWIVANVCEEGLGDLRGMRRIVDRFGDTPLAYVVIEGLALGQIYHRGLGVQRYRITARGSGGHSWVDYGKPSAIHELAALVVKFSSLDLPEEPRTTLNVGMIHGGTSVNTIAAEATLELDLRSADQSELKLLIQNIQNSINNSCHPGMKFETEIIGQRPAGEISKNHPLITTAVEILRSHGIKPTLNIGSTDANIPLSLGFPAVCIGLTTGGGAHTINEYIYTEPLHAGLSQLFEFVASIFHLEME